MVEIDSEKVQVVLEWGTPRTQKQLQNFLGFTNFYRQFIPSFAQIMLPITNLLKTKREGKLKLTQPLKWTMECQAAFVKLKSLFPAEPVLKYPYPNTPFVIQADASDMAVGSVLLQKNQQGTLQLPCTYASKKLSYAEYRWAVWERKLMLCTGHISPGDTSRMAVKPLSSVNQPLESRRLKDT